MGNLNEGSIEKVKRIGIKMQKQTMLMADPFLQL